MGYSEGRPLATFQRLDPLSRQTKLHMQYIKTTGNRLIRFDMAMSSSHSLCPRECDKLREISFIYVAYLFLVIPSITVHLFPITLSNFTELNETTSTLYQLPP